MRQPSNVLWLPALRRYVAYVAGASLIWEILQLPLYTIWAEKPLAQVAFAVAHCTTGDLLVALSALGAALVLVGDGAWPAHGFGRVAGVAVTLGVLYTMYSEWLNVAVRGDWTYSALMPVLPIVGTGLAPFAQWLVIPIVGLWWVRQGVSQAFSKSAGGETA